MRVRAVRLIVVLLGLCTLLGATSLTAMADATPVPVEATPPPRGDLPEEFCTAEEIEDGFAFIVERPAGGALIKPAATPGRDLYVVEIVLPSGSCVSFDSHYLHNGAIVWFVQSGTIEFAAQPVSGLPEPIVTAGDANGVGITVSPMPLTLEAGQWVGLDRAGEYSYRNAGSDEAVVIMAASEEDPFGGLARSCKGGCRKR